MKEIANIGISGSLVQVITNQSSDHLQDPTDHSLKMKLLSTLGFCFLLMPSALFGTIDVQTITVTTPVFHTWDKGHVKFAKIPHTGWDIDNPFYYSEFYSTPYFVLDSEKNLKQDINLISVFKIQVQSNKIDEVTTIFISTANAQKPVNHRFSVDEVINYTTEAIRSDFPDQDKYVIKVTEKPIKELFEVLRDAKEAGTEQPTTRPESKSEGGAQPQPESEAAPR